MAAPRWHDTQPLPPYDGGRGAYPDPYRGERSIRGGARRRSPHRADRWWGTRPGRFGVLVVIGCAAFGAAVTMVAGSEPGPVLGVLVVAGTLAAALAVRARAVHAIIPVPALAYLVAASAAGIFHDRAADASRTALATSAAQWFASGFIAMTAATAAAIAITAIRRPRAGRGPGHRSP